VTSLTSVRVPSDESNLSNVSGSNAEATLLVWSKLTVWVSVAADATVAMHNDAPAKMNFFIFLLLSFLSVPIRNESH